MAAKVCQINSRLALFFLLYANCHSDLEQSQLNTFNLLIFTIMLQAMWLKASALFATFKKKEMNITR